MRLSGMSWKVGGLGCGGVGSNRVTWPIGDDRLLLALVGTVGLDCCCVRDGCCAAKAAIDGTIGIDCVFSALGLSRRDGDGDASRGWRFGIVPILLRQTKERVSTYNKEKKRKYNLFGSKYAAWQFYSQAAHHFGWWGCVEVIVVAVEVAWIYRQWLTCSKRNDHGKHTFLAAGGTIIVVFVISVVWEKERSSNKLRNKQSQVTLSLNCRVMWLNQQIYLSHLFAQYKYMFSAISVQLSFLCNSQTSKAF